MNIIKSVLSKLGTLLSNDNDLEARGLIDELDKLVTDRCEETQNFMKKENDYRKSIEDMRDKVNSMEVSWCDYFGFKASVDKEYERRDTLGQYIKSIYPQK